jgi:hypothetical protein
LVLAAQGAGAPGTLAADVKVAFSDNGDGTTEVSYDADTVVGGMVGGVGQRMLTSVSRRMAGEFFTAVDEALAGGPADEQPSSPGTAGAPSGSGGSVFTAPARSTTSSDRREFLKGVAVGAGLVALGVVLGALTGRRR